MDVIDRIKTTLATYPVVLFMRGTPQFPMCELSYRSARALADTGAAFHSINVLEDPEIRAGLPQYANRQGFPQFFMQGELIGGCDIIEELQAAGELNRMLHDVVGTVAP